VRRDAFTLFFSMPLDATDFRNLNLSGCKRVQLPHRIALSNMAMLAHLASLQKRVIIRLEEPDIYEVPPATFRSQLQAIVNVITVDAVILGNEPDVGHDWEFGAPDWGQEWGWHHAARLNILIDVLDGMPFKLVSPAWMNRSISEDDPPMPGRCTWREIVARVYNKCDANGGHIYEHAWNWPVDHLRARYKLKQLQEYLHKPIYLDEFNISEGTQVERMRACISMADLLLTHKLGDRVEMFSPFVSNGLGNAYDPGMVMREEACYRLVGEWMRAG
jgi:hypothetical protein